MASTEIPPFTDAYVSDIETRIGVAQAQGILLGRHDCDLAEADSRLREMASEANLTISQMARRVVAEVKQRATSVS